MNAEWGVGSSVDKTTRSESEYGIEQSGEDNLHYYFLEYFYQRCWGRGDNLEYWYR